MVWLSFNKETIDDPVEIARLSHDASAFNYKISEKAPLRCFIAVQRTACTSVDCQHTAHVFTLKVGDEDEVWLFRDNIDPWTTTIEFDEHGFSKPTSRYFISMLNRATRIDIYWLKEESEPPSNQQFEYSVTQAHDHPDMDLAKILLPSPGNPNFNKPAQKVQPQVTPVVTPVVTPPVTPQVNQVNQLTPPQPQLQLEQ